MIFTKEQIREAYQKLDSSTVNFISDYEVIDEIDEILGQVGLSELVFDLANSQILYAVYNLQTLDEAISYIADISGKSADELTILHNNLQREIFDKIPSVTENEEVLSVGSQVTDWKIRVGEIAEKYELGEFQKDGLISICSLIIDSQQNKDASLSSLDKKLGVSQIVADQIIEELGKRVFSSFEKNREIVSRSSDKKILQNTTLEKTSPLSDQEAEPMEFIPANLPVSEEDRELIKEKVGIPKYIPTKAEVIKEEFDRKNEDLKIDTASQMQGSYEDKPSDNTGFANNPALNSRITYKQATGSITQAPKGEPVQRPSSIPRINLNDEIASEVQPLTQPMAQPIVQPLAQPTAQLEPIRNIIDTRLNNPVVAQDSEINLPEKQNPIVKSYIADPYREPIE
ncbi:MAG: hypothetical protein WAW92_04405 [Minisyncoccia bacterium]